MGLYNWHSYLPFGREIGSPGSMGVRMYFLAGIISFLLFFKKKVYTGRIVTKRGISKLVSIHVLMRR
jgi:hypothetical protein